MIPLLLSLSVLVAPAASESVAPAEGYGVAHVVLRNAEDWDEVLPIVCNFSPRVVVLSGAAPMEPKLPCSAALILTRHASETVVPVDEDMFYVFREAPSGAAEGALQRVRREYRAARRFFVLTDTYTPMASPRTELILQADDPVDAILAADAAVTDAAAGGVRPFGVAEVFSAGMPGESSFRGYWVDASGLRALAPASPRSAWSALSGADASSGKSASEE